MIDWPLDDLLATSQALYKERRSTHSNCTLCLLGESTRVEEFREESRVKCSVVASTLICRQSAQGKTIDGVDQPTAIATDGCTMCAVFENFPPTGKLNNLAKPSLKPPKQCDILTQMVDLCPLYLTISFQPTLNPTTQQKKLNQEINP